MNAASSTTRGLRKIWRHTFGLPVHGIRFRAIDTPGCGFGVCGFEVAVQKRRDLLSSSTDRGVSKGRRTERWYLQHKAYTERGTFEASRCISFSYWRHFSSPRRMLKVCFIVLPWMKFGRKWLNFWDLRLKFQPTEIFKSFIFYYYHYGECLKFRPTFSYRCIGSGLHSLDHVLRKLGGEKLRLLGTDILGIASFCDTEGAGMFIVQ